MIILADATEAFDKIQKKPPPFMDKKKNLSKIGIVRNF